MKGRGRLCRGAAAAASQTASQPSHLHAALSTGRGTTGCSRPQGKAAGPMLLGSPCQGLPSGKEVGSASTWYLHRRVKTGVRHVKSCTGAWCRPSHSLLGRRQAGPRWLLPPCCAPRHYLKLSPATAALATKQAQSTAAAAPAAWPSPSPTSLRLAGGSSVSSSCCGCCPI
jgi:hypothetical protein